MITAEYYKQLKSRLKNAAPPDNIYVVEGTVPVLISVPHAVPHMRDGRQKSDEVNTDVLGMILQEHVGCHLFVNAGVEGDPNYDESNLYRDKIVEYAKTHGVAFVIDLHGASAARLGVESGKGAWGNLYRKGALPACKAFRSGTWP